MVVAEGNGTYLECLPKSQHATVTWYKEAGGNSHELNQVCNPNPNPLTCWMLFPKGTFCEKQCPKAMEESHRGRITVHWPLPIGYFIKFL